MAKKTIYVNQAFELTLENGEKVNFIAGKHTVDEKIADHWFVKGFIGGEPESVKPSKELEALTLKIQELTWLLTKKDEDLAVSRLKIQELTKALEETQKNADTSISGKNKK